MNYLAYSKANKTNSILKILRYHETRYCKCLAILTPLFWHYSSLLGRHNGISKSLYYPTHHWDVHCVYPRRNIVGKIHKRFTNTNHIALIEVSNISYYVTLI